MSGSGPRVSVVVPTYRDETLQRCLLALREQSLAQNLFEVVLVDNADPASDLSGLHALPRVREMALRVLHEPSPGSYAARNRGIAASEAPVLAFTDADCEPAPDWLERALHALDEGADVVAGRVEVFARNADRPSPAEAYDLVRAFPQRRYVESLQFGVTANLVVRRAVFDGVGMFDANLFSGGDREFGQRATASGHRLVYVEEAVVRHPARQSLLASYRKLLRVYAGARESSGSSSRHRGIPGWRDVAPPLGAFARARNPVLANGLARRRYVLAEFCLRYLALAARAKAAVGPRRR